MIVETREIISIEQYDGPWAGNAKTVNVRFGEGNEVACSFSATYTEDDLERFYRERLRYIGGMATVCYYGRSITSYPMFPVVVGMFPNSDYKEAKQLRIDLRDARKVFDQIGQING